jgi:hypothetical protein
MYGYRTRAPLVKESVRRVERMTVSRIELVELIEGEVAKLSPRGLELWERLELHVEATAPEDATPETLTPPDREQLELADRMAELPRAEQSILERLMELLAGLRSSDFAESRGRPGEQHRNMAVIVAAGIKDRSEGRQINPDTTPEQAAARLREPG